MNIASAAERSKLPAKTIRYYEEIGLVVPQRAANGYRSYGEREVNLLRLVQRARALGFTVGDCRALLSLYQDKGRSSADVRALASDRLLQIDRKIDELDTLRQALSALVEECHGDDRPDCPILQELAEV